MPIKPRLTRRTIKTSSSSPFDTYSITELYSARLGVGTDFMDDSDAFVAPDLSDGGGWDAGPTVAHYGEVAVAYS